MSELHDMVFRVLMQNRLYYDPAKPKDYTALRQWERAYSAGAEPPEGVMLSRKLLGNVPAEWITGKDNPGDQIVLYIHGGGFVAGSSEVRRSFTF